MSSGLKDRLAIVTGTTSGLGEAVARALLDGGWRVLGVARRPPTIRHGAYQHAIADLGDAGSLEWFADDLGPLLQSASRVGLVNNAGQVGPVVSIPGLQLDELVRAVALSATGPTWLMGRVAALSGNVPLRIVNVSSGAATRAYPGWGAYCMGKAALRMASQVFAAEAEETPGLRDRDIAIVSYAPGVIDTPMQADVRASDAGQFPRLQRFLDLQSSGSLVEPKLPAEEIVKLLSRDDLPRYSETRFGE